MGIGGISIWQLLIVLAIVVLLFGTKKLKNIGGDLGGAIKSFKKAVGEEDTEGKAPSEEPKKVEDGVNPKTESQAHANASAPEAEKSETKQS